MNYNNNYYDYSSSKKELNDWFSLKNVIKLHLNKKKEKSS